MFSELIRVILTPTSYITSIRPEIPSGVFKVFFSEISPGKFTGILFKNLYKHSSSDKIKPFTRTPLTILPGIFQGMRQLTLWCIIGWTNADFYTKQPSLRCRNYDLLRRIELNFYMELPYSDCELGGSHEKRSTVMEKDLFCIISYAL